MEFLDYGSKTSPMTDQFFWSSQKATTPIYFLELKDVQKNSPYH